MQTIRLLKYILLLAVAGACALAVKEDMREVLVYPTMEDGSLMHWLAISPLNYDIAYLGDSMSADVLASDGATELTVRPREGDRVQGKVWHKMHYTGAVQGPSMCELFNVAGGYFEYAITPSLIYVYSPAEHPNAVFAGSSDDGLKVILNGKKLWSNQIQRSPTYDGDQAPAPLKAGWNTLLCVVDQVGGGHLLCARFLDGDKPITDLELSLDPATADAKRYPAGPYNQAAAELTRVAEKLRMDGKLDDALTAYNLVLTKYPLADAAPRAAYARAGVYYSLTGQKSLNQPDKAAETLDALLTRYGQDALAEYALLDLGKIQESALNDLPKAEATYRSMEERYPQSALAAKSVTELARLFADEKNYEDSLLTYRKAIKKYPNSDEVMTATLGIAETYRLAGDKDKARKQYEAARAMAQDWHDNKYGVDVGKQAWLQGILDDVRLKLGQL